MNAERKSLPAALDIPDLTIRTIDWGGMTIESTSVYRDTTPGEYFKGLPGDRCQCPHWGYVIAGRLRYQTATGEEVFNAGDVYYIGPGHVPFIDAGTELVEFSPADELAKTAEVVARNIEVIGLPKA